VSSLRPRSEYSAVGQCIYCGDPNDLTDEHIIPESLGGRLVLPKASCKACATTTGRFEQIVARKMYLWPLRSRIGISGKRKHKKQRPTHWPAELVDGSEVEKIQVEIGKLPRLYVVIEMPPAGIIAGEAPRETNPELKLHIKGDKSEMAQFVQEQDAGKLQTQHFFDWNAFNRLLAKIAHAYSVAVLGFDGLEYLLQPMVRGSYSMFSYLVGRVSAEREILPKGTDLALGIRAIRGEAFLSVKTSLLGGRTPTYEIVSARITDLPLLEQKIRPTAE